MGIQTAGSGETPFAFRLALAASEIGRFTAPLLVAFWLGMLVLIGKPNSRPGVYDTTVLLHVLFATAALTYMAWLLLARRLPGPTRLDWAALGLISVLVLAVATSVNPRVSLEASLLLAMAVVVFYVVHDCKALSVDFWARTLVVLAAAISILGLLTIVAQYAEWLQQVSALKGGLTPGDYVPPTLFRIQNVLNHPSPFAMFINIALPFAAARAVAGRGFERNASIAVLLIGGLAVFLSLTRGAWMATAASALVFAFLLYARRHRFEGRWHHLPAVTAARLRLGFLVCLLALGAIAAALLLLDTRPDWLFRATLDDRLEAMLTGLAIFGDHWLTGAGPYTYLLLDDVYSSHDSGALVIVHAHNIYVQVLADLGVLGAVAVLFGTFMMFRTFRAAWRAAGDSGRLYVGAGVAATAGFMVHGLSDAPPSWNSVFIPLAVVVALTARFAPPPPTVRLPRAGVLPRAAVLALIPVTLMVWLAFDTAHQHYDRSLTALADGRLNLAASEAVEAANGDDQLYAYSIHAGALLVQQYQAGWASGRPDPGRLDEGIAYLQHAVDLDPRSALGHANLALALQLKGDREGAVAAARLAIADEPGDEDVNAAAGTVFEWAGLHDEAVAAYAAALSLDPNLALAPFWSTTPERSTLRTGAIARSELDACRVGGAAAVYGVYLNDLPQLADACALVAEDSGVAPDRARLALILHRLGRGDDARAQATLARSLAPQDSDVLLSTALILSDGLADTRYQLLQAHILGNRDARLLLEATYFLGVGASNAISLPVEADGSDIPAPFARTMPARSPDSHVTPGNATSARSVTYFAWGAQRQAPPVSLIPGDWTMMVSPRSLLLFELAERHAAGQQGTLQTAD